MPVSDEFAWAPQPGPQHSFIECPVFEVVYGGARGGGKTDACIGDFAIHAETWQADAKGLFVRRNGASLIPTIERGRKVYSQIGAHWQEAKHRFVFPGGGLLTFRHLENLADADLYQGHDYTRVYVEELTQFETSAPVDKLKGTLRSAAGVPCGFRASCNPGGPGHTWVKARYIDPGPFRVVKEEYTNPFTGAQQLLSRVFIPARLTDNTRLLENDPLYVARLQLTGSKELVRAWLEGDWDIVEGAFFDGWSAARNVIKPFAVPPGWTRFCSFDEGYASPFSVGWWAIATDDTKVGDVLIQRGAMVRYREWYGASKPKVGLRLTAEEVATGIKSREAGEKIAYRIADDSVFKQAGGPSVHERMARITGGWRPADKTRVGVNGAFGGWDQMRARIKGTEAGAMLFVFETCRDFIRTVPVLQHDPNRAEDLDTSAEDHIADEARYACMSRPWAAPLPVKVANPSDLGRWRGSPTQSNDWKTA